jgi:hypothetical protein
VRLGWKTAICRQLDVNIMMPCTRANPSQSDIEALIERSSAMRETHYRAAYRRLQWHNDVAGLPFESTNLTKDEHHLRSPPPASSPSTAESPTSCAASENSRDEDDANSQQNDSCDEMFGVERVRQLDSEDEDLPSLQGDAKSDTIPSLVSWSSTSGNLFRVHMIRAKEKADLEPSVRSFPPNIWDDPVQQ